MGPNGAGKSSLMRTLATLQRPDSGEIRLDDIDITAEPLRLKQLLGYLPQEFGVYPGISGEDLLRHFATLKGITPASGRKQIVQYLLQKVNLYEARKRYVAHYSGGMCGNASGSRRPFWATPWLIIVDEPTAGLDPNERIRFNNLLSEISEEIIVILSTHVVDDVSDLCRDMAVMNEGRIVLRGMPSALMDTVKGKVWGRFVSPGRAAPPAASPPGALFLPVREEGPIPGFTPESIRETGSKPCNPNWKTSTLRSLSSNG